MSSSPAEAQPATAFDFSAVEPWSFDRWRHSPRLRPLDAEVVEDALAHVNVAADWRKPIPRRGYGQAVYEAITVAEAVGRNLSERQLAEYVGCSRSSVSRWKRWLRSHRYLTWTHYRALGARWARCVYITENTEYHVRMDALLGGSDAPGVITGLQARARGLRGSRAPSHRAELLLEKALARARPGRRNAMCFLLGRYLVHVGLPLPAAQRIGARFAAHQSPSFPPAEASNCIRSAYRRRALLAA